MLDEQVLPIAFGGGIDSKTDPKLVVPGKMLLLENATFSTGKRITKRNGYTQLPSAIIGGGNLVSPQMIKFFGSELLCQDSGNLYAYSPQAGAWAYKGPYTSVELTETFLFKEITVSGHVDCAVLGNLALYAWNTAATVGDIKTMAIVVDLSTNTTLLGPYALSTFSLSSDPFLTTTSPKCVALGTAALAVTYLTGGNLVCRVLSQSGASVSFGSEQTIDTGMLTSGDIITRYDIASTATGAVCTYNPDANTSLKVKTIQTSGAVGSTLSISDSVNSNTVPHVSVDSTTGNVWVYWTKDGSTSGSVLRCAVLSSTLTQTVAPTTVISAGATIRNISALPLTGANQNVYYNLRLTEPVSSAPIDETWIAPLTLSGSTVSIGSVSSFAIGVYPFSRAFSVGTKFYMAFGYRGLTNVNITQNQQPTFFVLDLSTAAVVARFAAGIAASQAALAGTCLTSVAKPSSTRILFGCGIEYQLLSQQTFVSGLVGAASIALDFASPKVYRATPVGNVLALNGALVSHYDGQNCTELGFHLSPEVPIAVQQASGTGHMSAGTYKYAAVYEWIDAQGGIHQSQPSVPLTATVTGPNTDYSMNVIVTMAYLTQKPNVSIVLYRTQNNGTTFYRVTDPVAISLNNVGNYVLGVSDTLADSSLAAKQELYTTGGVLENTPPPPSMILESRNNRLYLVDSENPNTIEYTKSFQQGVGISPSGFLTIQMDGKNGNIAGLLEVDDKMIVWKDRGIAFFAGDGANDTGTGSTLTNPQYLPSDVGLSSLKSVAFIPSGAIFQSAKGFYLLDRALGLHYQDQGFDGAAVDAYRTQDVTSAVIVSSRSQVRFLSSTGTTLVYDYMAGQWSVFTNHQGRSADNYQGAYTYLRTNGAIFQENATSFLDGTTAYKLRAQLSWLALSSVHGFSRARRVLLLGDFANGSSASHGVQISAAYDFGAMGDPVPYLPGSASASGVLNYRERLSQQKCQALSLLIEEIVSGATGEAISFTSLGIEAGMKRGPAKRPASQTVG